MSTNNDTEQAYDPLEHAKAIIRRNGVCTKVLNKGSCEDCFINAMVEERPKVCYTHNICVYAEKFIAMDRDKCKSIW